MKILAAVQGEYGKRIAENVSQRMPDNWELETIVLPKALPVLIDEPEEFLPSGIPSADLLLGLIESDGAAQLVPAIARISGVKSAIVPVDNPAWLPLGLQGQIEREMTRDGIKSVYPKTFCTLTEKNSGYLSNTIPYDDEFISLFARYFGRPKLDITLDDSGETIVSVVVERGSPCGSTHHAAEKMVGMSVNDAVPRAGLVVHQFPCLASMQQEEIDKGVFEPLMNISGYVMNEGVESAFKPAD
jgi:thymidylate synthase